MMQMFVAMFICQLLLFCGWAKGMHISGHGFCYFHACPGRQVRNDRLVCVCASDQLAILPT